MGQSALMFATFAPSQFDIEVYTVFGASLVVQMVKICLQCRRPGSDPWIGKIPWGWEQLPTPVFWPEQFHGQRVLAGYTPWGLKESNTTEQISLSVFTSWEAVVVKNPSENAGDIKDMGLIPGFRQSPGEGNGYPLPVFLPGESHGQRKLAGYSP